jgi:hypothetical protein
MMVMLNSREGAIVAWEDGLVASKRAQTEAIRQDYLTSPRALTSSTKHSINFNRMLEECHVLLSLQMKDLMMWEVKLVEEKVCDLHSFDELDLPVELEELHACMANAEEERATEAGRLEALVVEASNALVDLRILPIWEVPQNT